MTRVLQRWRETFTAHRWALNPFQMYDITILLVVAIVQIKHGASPSTVYAELEYKTLLALAVANVFGSVIALVGLHLRDLESALWVEFWGYVILVFVVGTYVVLVAQNQINAQAALGFGLAEAFALASCHRSIQILLYKRARTKRYQLAKEANSLQDALGDILPHHPVIGEEDTKR